MNLFNQSWLLFIFLIALLFILAIYPNGYVFLLTSVIGSLSIIGFVYRVLKYEEPVADEIESEQPKHKIP